MSKLLTVQLSTPITLPNNEVLTEVTLRKASIGTVAAARAAIVRSPEFGPAMVDDPMTAALFVIPKMVVTSNVAVLPQNWIMLADENDAETLVRAYGALRAGFDSIEAHQAYESARAEAEKAGTVTHEQRTTTFPDGEATPQS